MRKSLLNSLTAAMMALTSLAVVSCGNGAAVEKLNNSVEEIASELEPVFKGSPEAVSAFSLESAEDAVILKASLTDSIFDLSRLDNALADFVVAAYAHTNNNALIEMINEMSKAKRDATITLTQGNNKFETTLSGARMKTLFKTNLPDLNRTAAATNMAALTSSWAEPTFRTEGATDYECVYNTNQIIITVTYPNVDASPLKGVINPSPALKGMLVDAAESHYALYGRLRPAITTLMINLGIKELRLTYKYADGKAAPSVRMEWGRDL